MGEGEALRERSSAVFGNRYFIEIVTGIAERVPRAEDGLTVRMLAAHTGLTDNLVKPVVLRLINAKLLQAQPPDRPRGPRYHTVQRAGGRWDALVALCTQLAAEIPATC